MNRTIASELTDELALQDLREGLGLRNFLMLMLVYAFFGCCIVKFSFSFGGDAGRITLIVVAVVAVLIGSYYWLRYAQTRKSILVALAKLPHRTHRYTFTDDFFLVENGIAHSKITWEMLEEVECFENFWRLHFLNTYFLVPSGSIDRELASFIKGKARKGPKSAGRDGLVQVTVVEPETRSRNGSDSAV